MTIEQYLQNLDREYKRGIATEHTYRGDLKQLIESLVPDIAATNEPKRIKCGAPDYVLTRKDVPVGFIEAKDIGDKDLDGASRTGNKEQFDRYKSSLNNLIFTDYLDFHLYVDGEFKTSVKIGEVKDKNIVALPENFDAFANLVKDFASRVSQTITNSKKLAEMMAGKARILSDVIEKSLTSDEQTAENSTLEDQMHAFKQILIHDITPKEFSDVYAQTIAYGMFAARLHDASLDTFTRQEAAELIPKSNPFLRKLFGYIAGPDIDDRIKWIVDSLADIFRATDVDALLKNFGKATETRDPMIHFYETFLSEYDPKLRKSRGVWYTPEPVVNFIVRAVDDILKTEFNLPQGLADTSKTTIKVKTQSKDKRFAEGVKDAEKEVHRVQILDPATGTGTFLAEVVRQIHRRFANQQGIWSNYVENHLIPRLNGFELLMASYAMAHLKLDLLLSETGYKPTKDQRLHIYLTNSLEEHHPDTGTLWTSWLSAEANEANHIKRDTPVMCVIGNPPYSISSSNKSKWIQNLIADYKKDLNERKINLDDDYIKFIRFGQHFIDKNGEGVLAYISNNSFIDGVTHRQMRRALLQSFDKVFILNLHGNSNIQETCPDGSVDQNVFDIMQGVSINIFIKTNKKKESEAGNIFYKDLYGKRDIKYQYLLNESFYSNNWETIFSKAPYYFFIPKNYDVELNYNNGFSIVDLIPVYTSGIQTKNDQISIHFDEEKLKETIKSFLNLDAEELKRIYSLNDSSGWNVSSAQANIKSGDYIYTKITYRPFDIRSTIFTKTSGGFIGRPRTSVMKNLLADNFGLILKRSRLIGKSSEFKHLFICNNVCDLNLLADQSFVFPLYLYPEDNKQSEMFRFDNNLIERAPNLNKEIIDKIAEKLKLTFINEKETTENTFAPIDVLDYIYAVLHSPSYREKYKEFLKIDFPRVPYPKDAAMFWRLVKLGGDLRQIHLLESPAVENYLTSYPIGGDNRVGKVRYEAGKVWINDAQFFDGVPETAWDFYIGGYQPAQRWLKDRKDRELDFEDILHYQKIVAALVETERLMNEINGIEIE